MFSLRVAFLWQWTEWKVSERSKGRKRHPCQRVGNWETDGGRVRGPSALRIKSFMIGYG